MFLYEAKTRLYKIRLLSMIETKETTSKIEQKCPTCRAYTDTQKFIAIRLEVTKGFYFVILYLLVFLFGKFLNLDLFVNMFFSLLATFPLIFSIRNKETCLQCGSEFCSKKDH